jgi:hypothetical protein
MTTMADNAMARIRLRCSFIYAHHFLSRFAGEEELGGGTRSMPDPPPSQEIGWHRAKRRTVSHKPFAAPCVSMASSAYAEHVG